MNRFWKTVTRSGPPSDLWFLLLFVLLVLITFSPSFLSRASVYDVDLRHVETPIKWFLFSEQGGKLWTDRIGCGFPIHAYGEGGLFYPLNWVLYPFFPMPLAHDLNLMLHFMIAGSGAFLLGRRYYRNAAASAVSGVVFAFSGFMWVHMGHANAIQSCAWAPWAFLALNTEKEKPDALSLAGLAFCISLMLLSRAQYGFYTVVALGLHAAWKDLNTHRFPRFVPVLIGAAILASCIAAVQVLPTLEFVMNSDRSAGMEYKDQLLGAVSWSQTPWFIAPLWRAAQTQGVTAESIGYVGITSAVLMLISLLKSGRKLIPWILLLLVSLLFSMGKDFPPNALIYQIPGFSFFRSHARWLFVAGLAAAVLAGWGTNCLLHAINDPLRRRLFGFLIVLLVFFDLSHFLRPLVHFLDRSAQESVPQAAAVLSGSDRYYVRDNAAVFVPEQEARHYSPDLLKRYFSASEPLNANLGARYGLHSVQIYAGLYPRWSNPAVGQPTWEDLSSMDCRFVVSRQAIQSVGLKEIWRNSFVRIYENERAEPRARVASSVRADGSGAYSSGGKTGSLAEIIPGPREDEVRVSVHAKEAGFLVLADTFYPGWKALVNGREEEIFRANGWMRAVAVPCGESEVIFRYRPASFTWGIVVSGMSLVFFAFLLVWRCKPVFRRKAR